MTTFSAVWSDAVPAGTLAADDLDQAIRDLRRDIHERMNALFGLDWTADPLVLGALKGKTVYDEGVGAAIGAAATAIYTTVNNSGWAYVIGVFGAPVSRAFYDIVAWEVTSAQVSSTVTIFTFGVPGARTYSIVGNVIQLSVANVHTVKVVPFEIV